MATNTIQDIPPDSDRTGADGRPWPSFREAVAVWARIAAVADRHRDSQRLVRLAESVLNGEVTE